MSEESSICSGKCTIDECSHFCFTVNRLPCVRAKLLPLCSTLCDPMDCSLPDSSVQSGWGWKSRNELVKELVSIYPQLLYLLKDGFTFFFLGYFWFYFTLIKQYWLYGTWNWSPYFTDEKTEVWSVKQPSRFPFHTFFFHYSLLSLIVAILRINYKSSSFYFQTHK